MANELERFIELHPEIKKVKEFQLGSCLAYLVEKEGTRYVLKIGRERSGEEVRNVRNEVSLLQIVADVEGITHLVQDYGNVGEWVGYAILKEYVEETELLPFYGALPIRYWEPLLGTVKALHDRGIAGLELNKGNIKLSNSKPVIIDIGSCIKPGDNNYERDFSKKKAQDTLNLLSFLLSPYQARG